MIENINKELYKGYDELRDTYTQTQEQLRKMGSSINTWIPIDEENMLGFIKYKSQWTICHAIKDKETLIKIRPISQCPQTVKVLCVQGMNKLYEQIIENKKNYIPVVKQAVSELKSFYEKLKTNTNMKDMPAAWYQGIDAYHKGKKRYSDNPYNEEKEPENYQMWKEGWQYECDSMDGNNDS